MSFTLAAFVFIIPLVLFSCQLITFANSLDPVQYQPNVGFGLDTGHLTLISVSVRIFEKVNFD